MAVWSDGAFGLVHKVAFFRASSGVRMAMLGGAAF
jgi:hypothetical protein